jgi:hypothetical protein
MRVTVAATALLCLSSCGQPREEPKETYDGSSMERAVIVSYVPEGEDEEITVPTPVSVAPGGVGMAPDGTMVTNPVGSGTSVVVANTRRTVQGSPPRVLLGTSGIGGTYDLPRSCPPDPILSRIGRIVRVRIDRWTTADGRTVSRLNPEEVVSALCGDFRGRDVPRRAEAVAEPQAGEGTAGADHDGDR